MNLENGEEKMRDSMGHNGTFSRVFAGEDEEGRDSRRLMLTKKNSREEQTPRLPFNCESSFSIHEWSGKNEKEKSMRE